LEEAGLGTRFDVLQAEVRLADEQQNLRDAIANQSIARRDLTQTLGLSQATAEVTADGPPLEAGTWDMPLEDSIVLALRNRAELEQLLTDVTIAEESRTLALGAVRPQVGISAQYEVQDNFDDGSDAPLTDAVGLPIGTGVSSGAAQDGFAIQVQATWRLFDGGAARAQARQEEQNIAIAETNFSQQRNQVRFEVEQSFFNLQAEQENITTAKRGIEQAEESLRLARLRFQAGVGTQTDVINAQSELTSARGNLLNAIVDYNISLANLERSVSNLPDSELFDLP
ncbi:MAG: TolC family protein, partial [Cyanobacteria bacterium J06641_5]